MLQKQGQEMSGQQDATTNGSLLLATHRHRYRLRQAVLECWWRNACTSSPHDSGCSCLCKHRPHMTTSTHCEAAVHWVQEQNSGQGGGAQRAHLHRLETAGHRGRAGAKCCEVLQAREAAASVRDGQHPCRVRGSRSYQGPEAAKALPWNGLQRGLLQRKSLLQLESSWSLLLCLQQPLRKLMGR